MRKQKIAKMLLMAALCLLLAFPVAAAQNGSLMICNVEQPAVLYHVADEDGVLTADFSGAMPENMTPESVSPENAKTLRSYAQENNIPGQTETPNGDKQIPFPNLEQGYYLVCSTGETGEFAPFFISIPMTISGKTVYDIQAEPKLEEPADPSAPTEPVPPKPNIPQTGNILWPQYLLLILGALAIAAGVVEVLRGREKPYE